MTKLCKHCNCRIEFNVVRAQLYAGTSGWYHVWSEAARCSDDASFTYAEPK